MNIRVKGGAYGCMCNFNRIGEGYFVSYRDPNLEKTLETYAGVPDYLRNFTVSERDMTKYIIGTISRMDQPLEPVALGDRSFQAYHAGLTVEMARKERAQVLDTNQDTIRSLASYIEAMMDANTVCAIGNDKTIQKEEDIFGSIRNLSSSR